MILSQKLGKFIWQGDIYLTVRGINLTVRDIYLTGKDIYLTIRDIYLTVRDIYLTGRDMRRVTFSLPFIWGTRFWSCVRTLRPHLNQRAIVSNSTATPDEPFCDFRASRSGDRQILNSSGTTSYGCWRSKSVTGHVRRWTVSVEMTAHGSWQSWSRLHYSTGRPQKKPTSKYIDRANQKY